MDKELLDRIRSALIQAKKSEFYKKKLSNIDINIKSIDEFKQIPATTKEELKKSDPFDLLSVGIEQVRHYHETSGTTGTPVTSWFTEKDLKISGDEINESPVKFSSKDIVIIRFPYAISLPAHTYGRAMYASGATIVPVSRGSAITPYPRVINLMLKLKATILACNPYEAFVLADVAKKLGYDPKKDFNLRAVCVAGEMVTKKSKQLLEEKWGVKVYVSFGSTETSHVANECEYGNLHVAKSAYCEIVDEETKEEVKEGKKGNLYITQLENEAFPLIRYDIGDIAEIHESNCPCGNKGKILVHHGRKVDVIRVKDKQCTMYEFQELLLNSSQIDITGYWKMKVLEDKVQVYIEHSDYNNPKYKDIKLDLPFDNEVILVKKGELKNIDELLNLTALSKANYFME